MNQCNRRGCDEPITRIDLIPYLVVDVHIDDDGEPTDTLSFSSDLVLEGDRRTVDAFCSSGHLSRMPSDDSLVEKAMLLMSDSLPSW